MSKRILIAGGYGLIGSALAKHIREVDNATEIVLAGRNPHHGERLVQELGHARTAFLDLEKFEQFGVRISTKEAGGQD